APRGVIAGLLAGAAVLAGLRLAGVPLSEQASLAVAIAAPVMGIGLGVALAFVRRWSRQRAAGEIDRKLGLRARLSSALGLAASADPFARLAVADAERAAQRVRAR